MNHAFKLGALAAAALIACAPAHAAEHAKAAVTKQAVANPQASKKLNLLADEYYDALARFDPVAASESGDNRFIDQIGMSISPAERARQFARYKTFVKHLHTIKRDQLNSRDQTSYDILDYELGMALRFEPFPEHLLPLSQMDSMPVTLANYASGEGAQPLATVQDYRAYASRLAQLGPWVDQAIANMREGIKRGIVHPRSVMNSALPQFKQLVVKHARSEHLLRARQKIPGRFFGCRQTRADEAVRGCDRHQAESGPEPLERPSSRRTTCRPRAPAPAGTRCRTAPPGTRCASPARPRPICSRKRSTRSA